MEAVFIVRLPLDQTAEIKRTFASAFAPESPSCQPYKKKSLSAEPLPSSLTQMLERRRLPRNSFYSGEPFRLQEL